MAILLLIQKYTYLPCNPIDVFGEPIEVYRVVNLYSYGNFVNRHVIVLKFMLFLLYSELYIFVVI
jgi:hypothetical protein